jgi:hypothetical protein
VTEVPGWDYVVWRTEGRWAAATTPESRSVAGRIRVTDRRTASHSDWAGRGLARAPELLRIQIWPGSDGGGETLYSPIWERSDLHPDTRAAIDGTEETTGERRATVEPIRTAMETVAGAGEEEREDVLAALDGLLAKAEVDGVELPLWELQNAWWRLTRDDRQKDSRTRG